MDALLLPHTTLAFFALAMTILSLWVKPSPWIWGSFLVLAFALAYMAKIITPIALAPIGGLLVLHTLLKGDVRGLARFVLVVVTTIISIGLLRNLFPGFHNIPILQKVHVSAGAHPFSLYLNFDKPFIGLFVLAVGFPLIGNLRDFGKVMKIAIPLSLVGIIILMIPSLYSGMIKWDPKLPNFFWFFAIVNLIFVSVIEEAFWRGFIQREFFRWFGEKGYLANVGAVFITAFFFAALHYWWVPNIPFLSLVFIAGIIYGSIYQYTRALEASILCHWLFNITHLLLFTYPALKI
ncbi:MAG: hypothetical protein KR126chlam3_00441 [Chlamydiae bacterium]|nr:hypothetical protein [Chlamydiota bacterium]